MNIIILGAGAIGSLYGAKLSKQNDVLLVGSQKHVNDINKYGLKIIGIENKKYKIKATTKIKKIEDKTLILLTTKVYDSKKAINSIKNLIKKDTIILCLQNGLYCEDIVKAIVSDKCLVLRGLTSFGAAFFNYGTIQLSNYGTTIIGKSQKSKELSDVFNKCGLNTSISSDINKDAWKKVIVNCVINSLTAILRIENKCISNEKLGSIKKMIINECLNVAENEGIKFNIDFIKTVNEIVKDSNNISSMLQDLLKGKQTEVDYLNGAVVKLGKKYGIRCPINEALTKIIREIGKLTVK